MMFVQGSGVDETGVGGGGVREMTLRKSNEELIDGEAGEEARVGTQAMI